MKTKPIYRCLHCGHLENKWLGRCPNCGEWNTLVEQGVNCDRHQLQLSSIPLANLEVKDELRLDAGLQELNRVLGGGIMAGSAVLLGGEPGVGKSTLMLLLAASVKTTRPVLLISGEESAAQLKMRAERLGLAQAKIEISTTTELEAMLGLFENLKPGLIIIDSIQTVYSQRIGSVWGTVNQMKYAAQEMIAWAKTNQGALFLIGHVTKEGYLAGPKLLEHMVDTVLQLETADQEWRVIRATKNRFGSVDEIGIFEMTEQGLLQVKDPAGAFLEKRCGPLPPGVVVTPVFEGSRVLLIELQSLVAPARSATSRVFSDRIDPRLVFKAEGVLEKYCGISFADCDVYVNVAGGLSVHEVGIELPLCLSLYSSRLNLSFPEKTVICGEVSLAGEIREVKNLDKRLRTAFELGFTCLVSAKTKEAPLPFLNIGMEFKKVLSVAEAVRVVFG